MEIKIILFIVAMIFIIMILYKKSNPEQKQTMTREVRMVFSASSNLYY